MCDELSSILPSLHAEIGSDHAKLVYQSKKGEGNCSMSRIRERRAYPSLNEWLGLICLLSLSDSLEVVDGRFNSLCCNTWHAMPEIEYNIRFYKVYYDL